MKSKRLEFTPDTKHKALERAEGKCEHCGRALGTLYVFHHKKPASLGGDNSLENCEVRCRACHDEDEATFVKEHPGVVPRHKVLPFSPRKKAIIAAKVRKALDD